MGANQDKNLHDQVSIRFPGAEVRFQRDYHGEEPHEITVVLPRVEIRQSLRLFGVVVYSREVILNSITVADSPLHQPLDQPAAGRLKIAYRGG